MFLKFIQPEVYIISSYCNQTAAVLSDDVNYFLTFSPEAPKWCVLSATVWFCTPFLKSDVSPNFIGYQLPFLKADDCSFSRVLFPISVYRYCVSTVLLAVYVTVPLHREIFSLAFITRCIYHTPVEVVDKDTMHSFLLGLLFYSILWVIAGIFFKVFADKSSYSQNSKFFSNPVARALRRGVREKVSEEDLSEIIKIRNTFFIVSGAISIIKFTTLLGSIKPPLVNLLWEHNIETTCTICLCRIAVSLYKDIKNYPLRLLLYVSLATTIAIYMLR